MEITTVTTRVEWSKPHSDENIQKIDAMVKEMGESYKLISSSSLEIDSPDSGGIVTAVWKDLESANEYLTFINTLSPISAAIV